MMTLSQKYSSQEHKSHPTITSSCRNSFSFRINKTFLHISRNPYWFMMTISQKHKNHHRIRSSRNSHSFRMNKESFCISRNPYWFMMTVLWKSFSKEHKNHPRIRSSRNSYSLRMNENLFAFIYHYECIVIMLIFDFSDSLVIVIDE